jgi:glycosyltransferase involved in cell wall biosynthesis
VSTREAPSIAVVIPCFNEEAAIADVVRDFKAALPTAEVYVFDNNSSDDTAMVAAAAGAIVRSESRQGKGFVVQRMFSDVDADISVIVDGDGTYDASAAPEMVELLVGGPFDMVVATRIPLDDGGEVYRRGHRIGNRLFNWYTGALFGTGFTDIFSGYRVMSRRFVKSLPLASSGFEVETEITVHAVSIGAPCAEIPTDYGSRPDGSESKLRTYRDGLRIARVGLSLFRDLRPMRFFGALFVLCATLAAAIGIPIVLTWVDTGLVPRFPSAILSAALLTLGIIFLTCGIILESVSRSRIESRKLAYLAHPAPGCSLRVELSSGGDRSF